MLRLMAAITDKPEWMRKIFDDGITARWRKRGRGCPRSDDQREGVGLGADRARDRVPEFEAAKRVLSYDPGSRVAKADSLVSAGLQDELRSGLAPLPSAPEEKKDWHPGSDVKVLNLVHPSLFPLVYGRSEVLQQGRHG